LYNAYVGSAGKRKAMDIKAVFDEVCSKDMPLPAGRKYLTLQVAGGMKNLEDTDFDMPPVQYFYEKK
jgi:hypothetical protein